MKTITGEEVKEFQNLCGRFDGLSDLIKLISSKKLNLIEIADWIESDCNKSINRMKEINAKY
jgi:hypothetical protein